MQTENEKLRKLLAEALNGLIVGCYCGNPWCGATGVIKLRERINAALAEPVQKSPVLVRVLRVSCEESQNGLFRVHIPEDEWAALESSYRSLEQERDEARAEVEKLRERLQFDPGGSDKIDELEDAVKYLRAEVEHWKGAAKEYAEVQDEARAHLAAVEKLLPREAYISDKTLAENIADWIRDLRNEAKERSEFAAAETTHANRWAERAHAAEKRVKEVSDEAALAQSERDEARAEVERVAEAAAASLAHVSATAARLGFQRGAEAMREAAARNCAGEVCSRQILALPIPEDKR